MEKKSEPKCVICNLQITDEEEQQWASDGENHPGILGPCHINCYGNAVTNHPDLPWTDPISGEVDYEAMAEDLDVDTGEEEWDEGNEY